MADISSLLRKAKARLKPRKSRRLKVNPFGLIIKAFVSVFLVFIITGSICLMALAIYINKYIDTDLDLTIASADLNYSTQIMYYDEKGTEQVLYTLYGEQNREWVDYEDIPKDLSDAVVAIEDERFWTHDGVDWKRTLSAGVNLIVGFSSNYGGSTLTQQLIKNMTGDNEVTVQRKIQEILRALELEKNMSKEEILEMYLNTINLSQGCYGVQTAAQVYFGKDVSELTLAECASIAGITNLPSYYDPFVYPEHNIERQKDILWKMHELGLITDSEYEDAKSEKLVFLRDREDETEVKEEIPSYFVDLVVDTVIDDLMSQLGYSKNVATRLLYSGGLKIYTTYDPKVQSAIESVYSSSANFQRLEGTTQPQSAMIIYSNQGDILGVVGGRGTKQGARVLNRAQSLRSAGSAIKPLSSYSPAFEYGLITPYTVMDEFPSLYTDSEGVLVEDPSTAEGKLKAYPKNYYRSYRGLMTIRKALELSVNTIPVQLVQKLSLARSYSFLENKFGISSLVPSEINGDLNYGSLALGGFYRGVSLLEVVSAYTTFTNNGVHNSPRIYLQIMDNEGNTLINNTQESTPVLSEKANYYMNYLLESGVNYGTSAASKIDGIATAGKTGTTNSDMDRWFIGYTPYYVGGVWYGYDMPKEIIGADGNPALKIWKQVMDILHAGLPDAEFEKPEGLVKRSYCEDCGGIPTDLCKVDLRESRVSSGYFYPGDEPSEECICHVEIVLCAETGELANPFCTDTKTASAPDIIRESLVGTTAGDDSARAVKIEVPDIYIPAIKAGLMPWVQTSTKTVNGKTVLMYWVYGTEDINTFCSDHVEEPEPPIETEPETEPGTEPGTDPDTEPETDTGGTTDTSTEPSSGTGENNIWGIFN